MLIKYAKPIKNMTFIHILKVLNGHYGWVSVNNFGLIALILNLESNKKY